MTLTVQTADGLALRLTRFPSPADRGSVLLLHGASTDAHTFLTPEGTSLTQFLCAAGYDVWLLDWRGGRVVIESQADRVPAERFTLDAVAEHDFTACLSHMRKTLDGEGRRGLVSVVAHCVGAGAFAMAMARHDVARAHGISHVVLLTLGLFYEQSLTGLLKAYDHVLERVERDDPGLWRIHPDAARYPWPAALEAAFQLYPRSLFPRCGAPVCERLAFMFGMPCQEENLATNTHAVLPGLFGSMHRTLYMHCGQNVRRRVAAPFGASSSTHEANPLLASKGFSGCSLTLITGARNGLWHRDCIDRMHDYARRGETGARSVKHVLPGYGHQDLLWGVRAINEVFPLIRAGLAPG